MECQDASVLYLSWTLILGGVAFLLHQRRSHTLYGRYAPIGQRSCPARLAWFLQEVPAFLLPLLLLMLHREEEEEEQEEDWSRRTLLLYTFMLHYLQRSVVFSLLSRGRPVPVRIVVYAAIFCSLNGFLQAHHLLSCSRHTHTHTWLTDARMAAGLLLFAVGMVINIHSDHILRSLRGPGETVYRIPHGGAFELVSGANFLGEIIEWFGFAIAAWSLPSFAFAFFTACSIGPRAVHHHRDYLQRFEDYPRSRSAVIPFIL